MTWGNDKKPVLYNGFFNERNAGGPMNMTTGGAMKNASK
jgi:hypothetical protein